MAATNIAAAGPLGKALAGIGGRDAIQGLRSFRMSVTGARWLLDEQYAPTDPPLRSHVYRSTVSHDVAGDRLRLDLSRTITAFGLDVRQSFSEIVNGPKGRILGVDHLAGLPGGDLGSDATAAIRKQHRLLNPHLILQAAAEDPSLVTDQGRAELDDVAHHVLVVSDPVCPVSLHVHPATGRISWLSTRENDHLHRDTEISASYTGWRATTGGPLFPTRVTLAVGGEVVLEETRATVEANVALDGGQFVFPAEDGTAYVEADARRGETNHQWHQNLAGVGFREDGVQSVVRPVELAPGVFHLTGAQHHSLAVKQERGVVIVEAPLCGARSRAILDWVATRFPGTPVTHAVATHFHTDHSAGLREFVAAGAAVMAGPGSEGFYRTVFTAPSSIEPDSLARNPRPAKITEVAEGDPLTLPDERHPVVVHPIRNSHARDLVMVHLPNDRLLFQSDMFDPGLPFLFGTRWPTELHDAMVARRLTDVTIVGGHGGTATFAELRAALHDTKETTT